MRGAAPHEQRSRAGDTDERLLLESAEDIGILGEHLTRSFARQRHHDRDVGRTQRCEISVATV